MHITFITNTPRKHLKLDRKRRRGWANKQLPCHQNEPHEHKQTNKPGGKRWVSVSVPGAQEVAQSPAHSTAAPNVGSLFRLCGTAVHSGGGICEWCWRMEWPN